MKICLKPLILVSQFAFTYISMAPHAEAGESIMWDESIDEWRIFYGGTGCGAVRAIDFDNNWFSLSFSKASDPDTDNHFNIRIGDTSWASIQNGTLYPITIQFGDQDVWNAEAIGVRGDDGPNMLNIWMGDTYGPQIYGEFASSSSFTIIFDGKVIKHQYFSGSNLVYVSLLTCFQTYLDNQRSDDPFAQ